MGTSYTVSDGELVLTLESAEEGGYVVTCPADPRLVTEAETIEEAFEMARDALSLLELSDGDVDAFMSENSPALALPVSQPHEERPAP